MLLFWISFCSWTLFATGEAQVQIQVTLNAIADYLFIAFDDWKYSYLVYPWMIHFPKYLYNILQRLNKTFEVKCDLNLLLITFS